MDIADLVKQDTAKSMLLGFTPVQTFFCMLPAPERHNGCGDYDKMAELYRSPAQVLAVRSRLDRDPFNSLDSEDSSTVEIVIKFTNLFGNWNPHGTVPMGYEGVKGLEACLVRQALRYTPDEAKDWYNEKLYSYLRWVVQGRKTSASPFAGMSTNSDGTTRQSTVEKPLSTLSHGDISGSCASCGALDAAHLCKFCLIRFDDRGDLSTLSQLRPAATRIVETLTSRRTKLHAKRNAIWFEAPPCAKEAFYQYIQAPNGLLPVFDVTFEQGIVTKHHLPTSSNMRSLRYLPDSQSLADAALTGLTCLDVTLQARPIFDFLTRREYLQIDPLTCAFIEME